MRDLSSGPFRILLDVEVRRVQCRQCGAVKRERLTFLADNLGWLARWLLSFGSTVEIEQPERLKTMITELVEELQAHYLFSLSPLKDS